MKENYNQRRDGGITLKKENKKYADRSDERAYVSITSFAVAIGLLGAGIVISF